MSTQFVGWRADGTLVLLSSQEPRPDYLAIYRLDFRAHYFDVRVETLLFHDDPLKGHNGHYIGPYAYLFYHSTPENRPSYGSLAGYDNYSFDSWYAFLPYETLSNVHVKISLVFPPSTWAKSSRDCGSDDSSNPDSTDAQPLYVPPRVV